MDNEDFVTKLFMFLITVLIFCMIVLAISGCTLGVVLIFREIFK